jgi:hypothetical protein
VCAISAYSGYIDESLQEYIDYVNQIPNLHIIEENEFLNDISILSLGIGKDNPCKHNINIEELAYIFDKDLIIIKKQKKKLV